MQFGGAQYGMNASKLLTWLLASEAALGAVGLYFAATSSVAGAFGREATMIGYGLVLVVSATGAWLELRHAKRAEAFALVALAFAWIMALIGGLEAYWLRSTLQAVVALIAIFALVDRFIQKDIAKGERTA